MKSVIHSGRTVLSATAIATAVSAFPTKANAAQNTFTCGSSDPCVLAPDPQAGGTAIWGQATGSGSTYGVFGTGSVGVKGQTNVGGQGVIGASISVSGGRGVYGVATGAAVGIEADANDSGGIGLLAFANNAGTGNAIYASLGTGGPSGTGYAVFANGKAGGTTGWTTVSDLRLKQDIENTPYGLEAVLKLRPIVYQLKDANQHGRHVGFIAQELQPIIPEAVNAENSGMLSVTYTELIPVLAKAIQEQQKTISRLERERDSLTASVFSRHFGTGVALGLLPLGLVLAQRGRSRRVIQSSEAD